MASDRIVMKSHAPSEGKESKTIASESLRDLEADSASFIAARRPGSIWTIIGCVSCNFNIEHKKGFRKPDNQTGTGQFLRRLPAKSGKFLDISPKSKRF